MSAFDSVQQSEAAARPGSFRDPLPEPPTDDSVSQNVPKCPISADAAAGQQDPLSPNQRLAVELLAAGKKVSHVAQKLGIDRRTLYRWRREDVDFIMAIRRRRRDLCDQAADQINALLPRAVRVLRCQLNQMIDPCALRTALAILQLTRVRVCDDGQDD